MISVFDDLVQAVRNRIVTADDAADRILAQLSDQELLYMLDGDVPRMKIMSLPAAIKAGPISAGAIPRLGIPGILFTDGPRGVVMGRSTSFPVTMARAASWDPALEEQVGLAMGLEGRAQGANYSGAVCINLLRHPAWGRAQECCGEDPVLIGQMGAALSRGLRSNLMSCVKHYALNSMENARFTVDVKVDDHALHEVYLPHFRTAIMAGEADSVMSAYNSVNGYWADMNKTLLTDILRDEWGFTGFVTSDWVFGTHDAVASLEAGMDIEMPARLLRARNLPAALKRGRISRQLVLKSAKRIMATQLRYHARRNPQEPGRDVLANDAHRALARIVATRGMVLLQNNAIQDGRPLLPLDGRAIKRLAVIGRLAESENLGDRGSSLVHPPSTCSPLTGLREALPDAELPHADGSNLQAAVELAAGADAAVLFVGLTAEDEGESLVNDNIEGAGVMGFPFSSRVVQWLLKKFTRNALAQFGRGGDRKQLSLHAEDEALIAAVAAVNPRTLVVLFAGSAIIMERWRDKVPAILMAWYPGMEGGRAIADVLLGVEEPGGRLPFVIPEDATHLPFFDASAKKIVYDAAWGQRKLDLDGHNPAFRFGHGLGYTSFEMTLLNVNENAAQVRVRNTGLRDGATIVQIYAFDAGATPRVPQLVGFGRLVLKAGEECDVDITLDLTPIHERSPETKIWSRRAGDWRLMAAPSSPCSKALDEATTNAARAP
ncbi:beta-glucosidase [Acidocella aquatica]|uniref:Beta-glucosidase n=1 Tax=Acidocella aquatica TaxID=1922313 RepID=A0ABQ6ACY5_9PROT|nr:glycoside hydrolase family 3 C-terminal domain-containing protein [Acidocella aquatica]GLR68073.1 beta-glucosidase [Acidocella aquatica]